MSHGTDPRRFGPSSFTREQAKTWSQWLKDPRGADPGRDAGSRARPVSLPVNESALDRWTRDPLRTREDDRNAEVDELYERMVARGLVTGG